MTEEEWFAAFDPLTIFRELLNESNAQFVQWFSHRKLVLFAVACCRRIESRWNDPRVRAAVEAAERHCDARTNEERSAMKPVRLAIRANLEWARSELGVLAKAVAGKSGFDAARGCSWWASYIVGGATLHSEEERFAQAPLLRDIIGDPFRLLRFKSAWRTSTAVAVARQMYESREFGAMPILADALQDAGCEDEAILNHCRDASQPHVRGCWVCDLVLSLG